MHYHNELLMVYAIELLKYSFEQDTLSREI